MLEDQGKRVADHSKALSKEGGMSPGKNHKIHPGSYVVYIVAGKKKEVTVGKVTAVSAAEATVILHKHRPVTDHHFRLYWKPVYVEEGQEVLGSGSNPSKEPVPINRVLFSAQLHDGVLAHAAARRLDQSNYRYEHENLGTVGSVSIGATVPGKSANDESKGRMVERFFGAG